MDRANMQTFTMTLGLLLVSSASLCPAADEGDKEQKRLSSITWDIKAHKLTWVVERGRLKEDGEFTSIITDRYSILPDEAVMIFDNEKRGFSSAEAQSLHRLLDTLARYCAESVVWWDRGEGHRIEDNSDRNRRQVRQEETPNKRVHAAVSYSSQ